MIQYPDLVADAAGHVAEPYNISGSNDQLSISIDGGSAQVFTLTHGSAQTAQQVVTDLAALTGATATVVRVGPRKVVRIRTSSTNGQSSTILVNAPSNNANATLGFIATTYTGGLSGSYNFVGDTKQSIINGFETGLLNAGWITISGHGTTNLLMQSSMSPSNQNLRMRVRIKDNGGTCADFSIENAFGTTVGTNTTGSCMALLPKTGRIFKVCACKYQCLALVTGENSGMDYLAFGVPWVPPFLEGILWEGAWFHANSNGESGSIQGFRQYLSGGTSCWRGAMTNGLYWEDSFNSGGSGEAGVPSLWYFKTFNNNLQAYRWYDQSTLLSDPLIAWGTTGRNDEGLIRGQMWCSFVSSDFTLGDTVWTSVDSHTWQAVVANLSSPQLFIMTS